jgi:hypothetical protein
LEKQLDNADLATRTAPCHRSVSLHKKDCVGGFIKRYWLRARPQTKKRLPIAHVVLDLAVAISIPEAKDCMTTWTRKWIKKVIKITCESAHIW